MLHRAKKNEDMFSELARFFCEYVCCSVLQCVAVCCSVLRCVVVCSSGFFVHTYVTELTRLFCEYVCCSVL